LAYRSSKYKTGTSAEVYFAQDFRLSTDLLRGNLPKTEEVGSPEDYLEKVKRKLKEIHEGVRK